MPIHNLATEILTPPRANHDPLEVVEASVTESESVTSSGRRKSQIQYTPKAANSNNPALDNLPPQGIAEAGPEPVDQPNEIMQEADMKRLVGMPKFGSARFLTPSARTEN
jgi:hypothetical protein